MPSGIANGCNGFVAANIKSAKSVFKASKEIQQRDECFVFQACCEINQANHEWDRPQSAKIPINAAVASVE